MGAHLATTRTAFAVISQAIRRHASSANKALAPFVV
jgi:hypothetical protein